MAKQWRANYYDSLEEGQDAIPDRVKLIMAASEDEAMARAEADMGTAKRVDLIRTKVLMSG